MSKLKSYLTSNPTQFGRVKHALAWMVALTASAAVVSCGGAAAPAQSESAAPSTAVDTTPSSSAVPAASIAPAAPAAITGDLAAYAGTGNPRFTGDGGPASAAGLFAPFGLALDANGNLYLSTDNRVRKVEAGTGIITTVAGTGRNKYNGDGGPATEAAFAQPKGIDVDANGNIYVTERGSSVVRKIDGATGVVSTVAGGGIGNKLQGLVGDGKPATEAFVREPLDVAVDSQGNIYISGDHRIRMVDAVTGIITTFAGTGARSFSGDGGPANEAGIAEPEGLTIDPSGNLFFADADNHRIRKVDSSTGNITTVAGIGVHSAKSGGSNHNEVSVGRGGTGYGYEGDGAAATAAKLQLPGSVAVDSAGNVYFADGTGSRVRKIDAETGMVTTYIADETVRSSKTGKVSVRYGTIGQVTDLVITGRGSILMADTKRNIVHQASIQ